MDAGETPTHLFAGAVEIRMIDSLMIEMDDPIRAGRIVSAED